MPAEAIMPQQPIGWLLGHVAIASQKGYPSLAEIRRLQKSGACRNQALAEIRRLQKSGACRNQALAEIRPRPHAAPSEMIKRVLRFEGP
jgi:hypothetical protein